MWSDEDPAIGRAGAEATEQHVTGPYRFVVFEGIDHWIPERAAGALQRRAPRPPGGPPGRLASGDVRNTERPRPARGQDRGVHVGIADHFGWAVAVTASSDHRVVDRRRIELVEPGVCEAPIHYAAARLGLEGTAALIEEVRPSIRRATAAAFDELAAELGAPIRTISLRTWPPDFPTDLAVLMRSPWEARADAVMYRQELSDLAVERGWWIHLYDAKRVVSEADAVLGGPAEEHLQAPRAALGPPWTKDHRTAFAAAIVAKSTGA